MSLLILQTYLSLLGPFSQPNLRRWLPTGTCSGRSSPVCPNVMDGKPSQNVIVRFFIILAALWSHKTRPHPLFQWIVVQFVISTILLPRQTPAFHGHWHLGREFSFGNEMRQ